MQILTQMMNYSSNLCVETILFPIFGDSDITPKDRVVRGGKEKNLGSWNHCNLALLCRVQEEKREKRSDAVEFTSKKQILAVLATSLSLLLFILTFF